MVIKKVGIIDASKISGISPATLRNQIKKGYLPAYKKGNKYIIDLEDLEFYCIDVTKWDKRKFAMYPYEPASYFDRVQFFTAKYK